MGELPFSIDQFMGVFVEYNRAIWPAQIVSYVLGGSALYLVIKKWSTADQHINRILGVFWIWMGLIYHIFFFAEVNPAAYLFGTLFILQGLAFVFLIRIGVEFKYEYRKDAYGMAGLLFILYALIVYPLLGYVWGHVYPQAPVFGVAPCPTTIFTFGLLLLSKGKVPVWLLVVPGLWSLIGFSAAYQLAIYEDMGLVVAGIAGVAMLIFRNRKEMAGYAYSQ